MPRLTSSLVVLGTIAWSGFCGAQIEDRPTPSNPDLALLAEHQIPPTLDGVTAFLKQLRSDPALEKQAAELIRQLAADEFRDREAAVTGLVELPVVPLAALQAAAKSPDQETALRARQVLAHPQVKARLEAAKHRWRIVAAVLRTIRERPSRGTTPLLLQTIPLLDRAETREAAVEAVAAVATPDDLPLLRESLAGENVDLRIAAIRGLGRAGGRSVIPELRRFSEDRNPHMALAAAHALAELSDRTALSAFVELAGCDDETVRILAVQVLRAWTGKNFKFNPFDDPLRQQAALGRWKAWIAGDGATAELQQPFTLQPLAEDLRRGLLMHLTFDDDEQERIVDAGGHGRDGVAQNAHRYVDGVAGKALELTGAGVEGDAGGYALLKFIDFSQLDEFTVALWVKEQRLTHPHGEAYVSFGIDQGTEWADNLSIGHYFDSVLFRVGGMKVFHDFNPADRDRWVHYAMTYSDAGLLCFWNGRLVGRADRAPVRISGQLAALGCHWWNRGHNASTRFVGALDDVRVYSRALDEEQIRVLVAN